MSPRFRWSVGRARVDQSFGPASWSQPPDVPPTGSGLGPTGTRIVGELHTIASGGRTGALHVVGRPGGMVYLAAGHVVQVEAWTTPGAEALLLHRALGRERWRDVLAGMNTSQGRDVAVAMARDVLRRGVLTPLEVDLAVQRAVVDAACALLTGTDTSVSRTRFLRDEHPWLPLSDPQPIDELVARAVRHGAGLARVADRVRPDTAVARRPALPTAAVRLTGTQWDLVAYADGATSRDLAWLLGRGVATTTLEVSRLESLGLLEAVTADA